MQDSRTLAVRLYARMSRDPKFRKTLKAEGLSDVLVCLDTDLVESVDRTIQRNYGNKRIAIATYFPARHEFHLSWRLYDPDYAPGPEDPRPRYITPADLTMGEQADHADLADQRQRVGDFRPVPWPWASTSQSQTYSTFELEEAMT